MVTDRERAAMRMWGQALVHAERSSPESLEWARAVGAETFKKLTSKQFLSSYCYVVYASGFKASIVQEHFADLKKAFLNFVLSDLSSLRSPRKALKVIASERKAQSFLAGAKAIAEEGYSPFKTRLQLGGPDVLEQLPGIGPITKYHLAKNIGLADVAKPDIWLLRAAEHCGYGDAHEFVQLLHEHTGESRHVVDVVIWTWGKDGKIEAGDAKHG